MAEPPDPSARPRRRVVRKGTETPYEDPTPDDQDLEPTNEVEREAWLKAQRPPHHG